MSQKSNPTVWSVKVEHTVKRKWPVIVERHNLTFLIAGSDAGVAVRKALKVARKEGRVAPEVLSAEMLGVIDA